MKTKNFLFSMVITIIMWCFTSTYAVTIDSQIEDELNEKAQQEMVQNAQNLNEKVTFSKAYSCESIESVMSGFLETYKKLHPKRSNSWWVNYVSVKSMDEMMVTNWAAMRASDTMMQESESVSAASDMWMISDFSTTNIQKIWVDEPEILKSNGKYLFYYSEADNNDRYISIIRTPVQKDLSDAEIVAKINIPSSLHDIQLFLNWNKLIILGSRYSSKSDSVSWSNRSLVIIYDISDLNNLVLEKLTEVYWSFEDARMIWDQLYLISSINLNWYDIARNEEPILFKEMQPKLTDITLNSSSISKKSYDKNVTTMPCENIFYLLPSEDTMKETNIYPNFTLISQISLNNLNSSPKQNLVFGNVNEIHMSQNSLYLPSPIYFSTPTRCSLWWCYSSWYYRNENTLVHKFNLWKAVTYQDSTIIPWTPLNQYSMDEYDDWNFRILTTTWYDQSATHLSILDKNMKIKWSLLNIEPWENFKSSRYIWDKLYLVTYQTIDPLFVVDLENISKPKIIWELKIPWYSTYLHPYSDAKDGVQYLIWLWYSTTDNGYGWLKADSTKVDLYKIDYKNHETAETKCSSLITKNVNSELTDSCTKASDGKKCNEEQRIYEDCLKKVNPDNIAVSAIASYEFSGDISYTPALENPRVFVRRSNKQELVLPMVIAKILQEWTNENNWEDKYDAFLWLKWLSIKTSTALIKEILSQNFVKNNNEIDNYKLWDFEDARVGYIDDTYYFLVWWFAGFLNKDGKVVTLGSL